MAPADGRFSTKIGFFEGYSHGPSAYTSDYAHVCDAVRPNGVYAVDLSRLRRVGRSGVVSRVLSAECGAARVPDRNVRDYL